MWRRYSVLTILLSLEIFNVHSARLRCYRGSTSSYLSTPLYSPLAVMTSDCMDLTLPTVVYTFGYRGRCNGPATSSVLSAYINTRKRNVILLDWEYEARSGLLGIPLGYVFHAVPNAKRVGTELGEALVALSKAGLNMTQIHLVGHSLGAHVMGHAGRQARRRGFTVARITGLDPARLLFEGSLGSQSALDRTCARFVDIIHSDPGGYGTSGPAGSVDIWPNYLSGGSAQPGCKDGDFEMFTPEDLCNHDMSWRYYVESIRSPTMFPAMRADSFDDWLLRASPLAPNTVYLGELTNTRARGNYFLSTNTKSPFGKGLDGLMPDINEIKRRRRNTQTSLRRLLKYLR